MGKQNRFWKAPRCMSYQDRLRGYERDKQRLVATAAYLPADEFAEKLKVLQEKWKI
jgi:hypothetical protein